MRFLRDHAGRIADTARAAIEAACARMVLIARDVAAAGTKDLVRGREGEAPSLYFSAFDQLLLVDDADLRFGGRSRRPPLDRVNALLSFLYAMLGHDCRSALEAHGLDPQVGYLHEDKPGRAGLALDLMEDLRPVMADRLALSLINRGQLRTDDFVVEGGRRCPPHRRRAQAGSRRVAGTQAGGGATSVL